MHTWRDKVWERGHVRTWVHAGLRGQGKSGASSGSAGAAVRHPGEQLQQSRLWEGCCPQPLGSEHHALSLQIRTVECRAGFSWCWEGSALCVLRDLYQFFQRPGGHDLLRSPYRAVCWQQLVSKEVCAWCARGVLGAALVTPRLPELSSGSAFLNRWDVSGYGGLTI